MNAPLTQPATRPRLLFVGAFPPAGAQVVGGNVTDCAALLDSSLSRTCELILLDSTQLAPSVPPLAVRAANAFRRSARYLALLARHRPDAVLAFASSGMSFVEKSLYCGVARLIGARTMLSVRSGHFMDQCRRSPGFRRLARLLMGFPEIVLPQGERWASFFLNELHVPPERCIVLENWVASDELLRIGRSRQPRTGALHLVFLGRIERFKGVFELLAAYEILRRRNDLPPLRLTFGGDGPELKSLQSEVMNRGLANDVHCPGSLNRAEALRLLEDADVFVLPSETEGLPNAMIEAMAAGLPVIVTPVGSIPDVIEDGVDGILLKERTANALARAIESLVLEPQKREAMGRAACRKAAERFGVERAATLLRDLAHRKEVRGRDIPKSVSEVRD